MTPWHDVWAANFGGYKSGVHGVGFRAPRVKGTKLIIITESSGRVQG
jgi:hypothetical protein